MVRESFSFAWICYFHLKPRLGHLWRSIIEIYGGMYIIRRNWRSNIEYKKNTDTPTSKMLLTTKCTWKTVGVQLNFKSCMGKRVHVFMTTWKATFIRNIWLGFFYVSIAQYKQGNINYTNLHTYKNRNKIILIVWNKPK